MPSGADPGLSMDALQREVVAEAKLLSEAGADGTAKTRSGLTPRDLAVKGAASPKQLDGVVGTCVQSPGPRYLALQVVPAGVPRAEESRGEGRLAHVSASSKPRLSSAVCS